MTRLQFAVLASTAMLPACVSTSFAPPTVDRFNIMNAQSLTRGCRLTQSSTDVITSNVPGTVALIDNYHASYDCWRRLAADGRRLFQIPAFLSLVGSTTAVALGAGPDVAIAGGAGNSIFTAGNNYFSPAEQTEILNHALDAITCVRSEATGMPAYTALPAVSSLQRGLMTEAGVPAAHVEITYEQQYHQLVRSRLEAVDHIVAQRLSRRGTFDPAGVAAQIREAAAEIREREAAAGEGDQPPEGLTSFFGTAASRAQVIELQLSLLQPKLDQCVLRAKT